MADISKNGYSSKQKTKLNLSLGHKQTYDEPNQICLLDTNKLTMNGRHTKPVQLIGVTRNQIKRHFYPY